MGELSGRDRAIAIAAVVGVLVAIVIAIATYRRMQGSVTVLKGVPAGQAKLRKMGKFGNGDEGGSASERIGGGQAAQPGTAGQ